MSGCCLHSTPWWSAPGGCKVTGDALVCPGSLNNSAPPPTHTHKHCSYHGTYVSTACVEVAGHGDRGPGFRASPSCRLPVGPVPPPQDGVNSNKVLMCRSEQATHSPRVIVGRLKIWDSVPALLSSCKVRRKVLLGRTDGPAGRYSETCFARGPTYNRHAFLLA